MSITPIDDALFRLDVVHDAAALAHDGEYARLTDEHLRHWAVYDRPGADALALKRDAAVAKLDQPTASRGRHDTESAYVTHQQFNEGWKAVVGGVADGINAILRPELNALHHEVADERNLRDAERDVFRQELAALRAEVAELKAAALVTS